MGLFGPGFSYPSQMDVSSILFFSAGLLIGLIVATLFHRQKQHSLEKLDELRKQDRTEVENTFATLSHAALTKNTETFLNLAKESLSTQTAVGEEKLDQKKQLIDASLNTMAESLKTLNAETLKLATGLTSSQAETSRLRTTTEDLRNVLSSSQARGQWGERMVEDILNLVGLEEHLNFEKQKQVASGERPDFTFLLPKDKTVNLDAKFPLAHYQRYIEADVEAVQETEKKQFLDDVKAHIKAVAARDYINPADNTVDYVLMFIPNESIYAFIHQSDPAILDLALKNHIVLCSPITLYAVVSLIHQAVSNFAMEEQAGQIIRLLTEFRRQWELYKDVMERMGARIDAAQKEYEKLTTTRTRQLEKPLREIDEIQLSHEDNQGLLPEGPADE